MLQQFQPVPGVLIMNNFSKKFLANKFRNKSSLKGFTLVELMISMTLGLTLVAGVFSVYTGTISSSSHFVSYAKLDQELRAIMDLITREVRRAGYDASNAGSTTNFGINESSSGCLRYSYDMGSPPDGSLQTSEQFGFKLTNKIVKFGTSATSCTNGTWNDVSDSNLVEISNLNFTLDKLCVNLNDSSDCMSVLPTTNDMLINKYQLQVSLTANLKNDSNVSRTLTSTIRLHNDLLIKAP